MTASSKLQAFHAALGSFLLAWAELEVGIDLAVIALRQKNPQAERKPKIPHQLAEKVKFVRKHLDLLQMTEAAKGPLLKLLDEIEGLSATRHDFVHGAVIEHREGKIAVTALMGRVLQPHGLERRVPVEVTTKGIKSVRDQVYLLGEKMFDFVEQIDR